MKIAVSSQNKREITGHAGKASRFYIYTIASDANKVIEKGFIELAKEDLLHNRFHESENPYAPHPIFDVDMIITGGAGQGFVNRLASQGVQVIITDELEPDMAIKRLLDGTLSSFSPSMHHH